MDHGQLIFMNNSNIFFASETLCNGRTDEQRGSPTTSLVNENIVPDSDLPLHTPYITLIPQELLVGLP